MMPSPFKPAWATFLVKLCNPITRQAIELESCSNPLWIQQVKIEKNNFRFRWGFLEVTSQRGHVLEKQATFGQPWAPTH